MPPENHWESDTKITIVRRVELFREPTNLFICTVLIVHLWTLQKLIRIVFSTCLNLLIYHFCHVTFRSGNNIAVTFDNLFIIGCLTRKTNDIVGIAQQTRITMFTVTSPTLVVPYFLRKAATRSCSLGIFSAKIFFRSVKALLIDLMNKDKTMFCKNEKKELIHRCILKLFKSINFGYIHCEEIKRLALFSIYTETNYYVIREETIYIYIFCLCDEDTRSEDVNIYWFYWIFFAWLDGYSQILVMYRTLKIDFTNFIEQFCTIEELENRRDVLIVAWMSWSRTLMFAINKKNFFQNTHSIPFLYFLPKSISL